MSAAYWLWADSATWKKQGSWLAIETAHSEPGMCDYQHAERSLLAVDVLLPKLVFWMVIKSKPT